MNLHELKHRNDITIKRPKTVIVEGQETVAEWTARTGKKPDQIKLGASSFQQLIDKRYKK